MEPDVVNLPQVTPEAPAVEVVTPIEPKPGEKTDPALLLKSLQEEREEKKRERDARIKAETELANLKAAPSDDVFSDEGRAILKRVEQVQTQVATMAGELTLKDVYGANPAIADKKTEFDEFRTDPQNAGMSLETAARVFIVERGLSETPPTRKGLEQPSGGGRTPVQGDGVSAEEADQLRQTNYREYSRRIKNGTLKIRA